MITVTLIGSGNVAHHLIHRILESDTLVLQQIYARNLEGIHADLDRSIVTDVIESLKPADLFIVAVSDNAIEEVTDKIQVPNQLVVHVSGNTPMDCIASKHRAGVLYMLQTFSKDQKTDFSSIPFCLEAESDTDLKLLKEFALHFSKHIYFINSIQRQIIHLAAVFVNNFSNHMFVIGEQICQEHQVPFEILKPLIMETALKVQHLSPLNAQTGPALRNDTKTIARHLELLKNTEQQTIYKLITHSIQENNV